MEKNSKLSKAVIITAIVTTIITYRLLDLFLTGKIINIPKGTHQGGIISAVGFFVIIFTTCALAFVAMIILKKYYSKKSNGSAEKP